jgi:hypothetical protein
MNILKAPTAYADALLAAFANPYDGKDAFLASKVVQALPASWRAEVTGLLDTAIAAFDADKMRRTEAYFSS